MKIGALALTCLLVSPAFAQQSWNYHNELQQLFRIDQLPQYRDNSVVSQVSSYDTTGGNDDGFSGKYSYIRKEAEGLVIADLKGPGIINRIWTPTPTRDTLKFYFDGESTPRITICFADLFSGNVFPFLNPVCGNAVGGYYACLPIPYQRSCKIIFAGKLIQFHQIQYRTLNDHQAVTSYSPEWTTENKAALAKACDTWKNYGHNILESVYGKDLPVAQQKEFVLKPGQEIPFFSNDNGGRIIGMELTPVNAFEGTSKDILIKANWDNETSPAFYAPVSDFFGFAYGTPSMQSLINGTKNGRLYNYMPMPFASGARMGLVYKQRSGKKQLPLSITAKTWYLPAKRNADKEGKLYAAWKRERNAPAGIPHVFASLKGRGHYIGSVLQVQGLDPVNTGYFEGDDSTVSDGKMRIHGTGSEDYFNGGWYLLPNRWDRGFSLPVHGCLEYSVPNNRSGGYRFYIGDKLSFEKDFYMSIEHGPEGNQVEADYTSVAFYYADGHEKNTALFEDSLSQVYLPSTHFYHRDLTKFIIGNGTSVASMDGRFIITTQDEGLIRIELGDLAVGKYEVMLSYFEDSEGGEFSLWQREKMITEWISSYNKDRVGIDDKDLVKDKKVALLEVTDQLKDVTLRTRKTEHGGKFNYVWIKLKLAE